MNSPEILSGQLEDSIQSAQSKIYHLDKIDSHLVHVERVLTEIHRAFYSETHQDVKKILSGMKKSVFNGLKFAFTGVIASGQAPENAVIWKLAENFGAQCQSTLDKTVDFLVSARHGTEKFRIASKLGIKIVSIDWYFKL